MSQRFREVLDEASKRVQEWPEWKKSEALKLSEQREQTGQEPGVQGSGETFKEAN